MRKTDLPEKAEHVKLCCDLLQVLTTKPEMALGPLQQMGQQFQRP